MQQLCCRRRTRSTVQMVWWFSYSSQKPGEEELHKQWLEWLDAVEMWPDNFEDGSWQFMLPEAWRNKKELNKVR